MKKIKRKNSISIIFDGECLMCNSFLRLLDAYCIKTRSEIYAYPSIDIYQKYNSIDSNNFLMLSRSSQNSILVIKEDHISFTMSKAIEEIFLTSNSIRLKLLAYTMRMIPYSIKNFIYRLIANNRRQLLLFKRNQCRISALTNIHVVTE